MVQVYRHYVNGCKRHSSPSGGSTLRTYFNCNGFSVILKSFLNTEGRSVKFKGALVIMKSHLFTFYKTGVLAGEAA